MGNLTPSSRSLVLRHGELDTDMVLFRQENDGRLFVTINATDVSDLQTPGLLRCTNNTLVVKTLKGAYHFNNKVAFICKELLEITQHDTATPALGLLLEVMFNAGAVADVELTGINESMVVARKSSEEIFAVFFVDENKIYLTLLDSGDQPDSPALVLHNDMPVESQAALLRFTAGANIEHFSLYDFMLDVNKKEDASARVSNKLSSLFAGGGDIPATLEAYEIRSAGIDISNAGNMNSAWGALQGDLSNTPSTALQYRVVSQLAKATFIEPLRNRKEIIIQTDKAIRVGWGDDSSAAADGFLIAAGGSMGCSIASYVSMSIRAVNEDANVFILQLGV